MCWSHLHLTNYYENSNHIPSTNYHEQSRTMPWPSAIILRSPKTNLKNSLTLLSEVQLACAAILNRATLSNLPWSHQCLVRWIIIFLAIHLSIESPGDPYLLWIDQIAVRSTQQKNTIHGTAGQDLGPLPRKQKSRINNAWQMRISVYLGSSAVSRWSSYTLPSHLILANITPHHISNA